MDKNECFKRIRGIIAENFDVDIEEIQMTTNLVEDFGADSLDLAVLTVAFEEEFQFHIGSDVAEKAAADMKTVEDIVNYLCADNNFTPFEEGEIYEQIVPVPELAQFGILGDTIRYVQRTKDGLVVITYWEVIVHHLKKSIKENEDFVRDTEHVTAIFAKKVSGTLYIVPKCFYKEKDKWFERSQNYRIAEAEAPEWAKVGVGADETDVTDTYCRELDLTLS